jgi:hypothetical protein
MDRFRDYFRVVRPESGQFAVDARREFHHGLLPVAEG